MRYKIESNTTDATVELGNRTVRYRFFLVLAGLDAVRARHEVPVGPGRKRHTSSSSLAGCLQISAPILLRLSLLLPRGFPFHTLYISIGLQTFIPDLLINLGKQAIPQPLINLQLPLHPLLGCWSLTGSRFALH